jgi:peptidoglycan hydrolase CwlO-like protein
MAAVAVALAVLTVSASAAPESTVSQPEGKMVAQATPKAAPRKAETPADAEALESRVRALENQSTVLSEDVGKTRLEQRTQLEDLAKRQADAIAKLNQQLADTNAQLQQQREKEAKRTRQLWLAVGVLVLGVIAK